MSSKSQAFEAAQAYLKRSVDPSGRTLHDHLTDVLLAIARDKPENPLESFESISVRVKESYLPFNNQQDSGEIQRAGGSRNFLPQLDATAQSALQSAIQRTATLLKPEPLPEDAEQPDWDAAAFPDLIQQAKTLEWAGVSLGEEDLYRIVCSLQQLAAQKSLTAVRLFGKIFGTQKDYIIAEAKVPSHPEPAEDVANSKDEPAGQGVNELCYFVCNTPGGAWTQLPYVSVQMIKKARNMRRLFTGDLQSAVPGYPHFPWTEAHYLRAQIARIVSATTLAPKGLYSLNSDEEVPVVQEDEEYKGSPLTELSQLDSWVHCRSYLNKQGRLTKWIAPEKEEEEQGDEEKVEKPKTDEQLEDEADAAEEDVEQLRAISEDGTDSWSLRVAPSHQPSIGPLPHSVAVVRSRVWPGAVSAVPSNSKQVVNFYVGYGQKNLGKPYTPPPIPKIQPEYVLHQKSEEDDAVVDLLVEQTDPLPPPPKTAEELAAEQAEQEQNEEQEEEQQEDE